MVGQSEEKKKKSDCPPTGKNPVSAPAFLDSYVFEKLRNPIATSGNSSNGSS